MQNKTLKKQTEARKIREKAVSLGFNDANGLIESELFDEDPFDAEAKRKKLSGITKFVYETTRFSYSLYLTYMIFVYYFTIPLLLYSSPFDFMAILVFMVTTVTLVFQLRLWNNFSGTEKFQKMFKLWKWVYFSVTLLCIWRYLMFFTRFATFERMSV